jgi:hypothetical protein
MYNWTLKYNVADIFMTNVYTIIESKQSNKYDTL